MLINSTKTLINARNERLIIENKIFDLFSKEEIRNVLEQNELKGQMIKYISELKSIEGTIVTKMNIHKEMEQLRNLHSEPNTFVSDF